MKEEAAGVLEAALREAGPKGGVVGVWDGGKRAELLVRLVVAGQRHEGDAAGVERGGILDEAVGPVAPAAQDSGHDHAGARGAAVEVQVHRERVREVAQGQSRSVGASAPRSARAAERRASSLSAAERTTRSAGVCRGSTGWAPESSAPGVAARRCIRGLWTLCPGRGKASRP
jgi:hypothetical protein